MYNSESKEVLKKKRRGYQKREFWLIVLVSLLLLVGLYCCFGYSSKTKEPRSKAIPVVVARATTMDIPMYLSALGTVIPTATVTVKSQITGTIQQLFFKDGQMVKKGDVLAQIDPRPYEAQLQQYQGQLLRDHALLDNALIDLKRYQRLWQQNSISQQTLATQESLVKQYQGNVQTDQGLIAATKINLMYCRITAPVSGRIGLGIIDPGNVVQVSDTTGIAIITTLDPIYVYLPIPQDSIPEIHEKLMRGITLAVEAYDRQQAKLLGVGVAKALDSQINTTTGTVILLAQFKNSNYMLFPNQFVNARIQLTTLKKAIVIPTEAIQLSPKGSFVYVLTAAQKVKITPVHIGAARAGVTAITSGLAVGTTVVTDGTDKLVDGAKVKVANRGLL